MFYNYQCKNIMVDNNSMFAGEKSFFGDRIFQVAESNKYQKDITKNSKNSKNSSSNPEKIYEM